MTQTLFSTALVTAIGFTATTLGTTALAETPCDATMMQGSIAQLSTPHATVQTSILIDAAPAEVWATLTDFDAMASWSSGTFQDMTGDIEDGGSVSITFIFGDTANGAPNVMEILHTLIYNAVSVLGWSDPFPEDSGGGHDNHLYRVEACGDQTLFIQSDEIVGNPYAANFVTQLLPMYQTFNSELKAEVEDQS